MSRLSNLKTKKKNLGDALTKLQNKEDFTSRVAKAGQALETALDSCVHRTNEIDTCIKPVLEFSVDFHSDLTESIISLGRAIKKNDAEIAEEEERIRVAAEKAKAEREAKEKEEAEKAKNKD